MKQHLIKLKKKDICFINLFQWYYLTLSIIDINIDVIVFIFNFFYLLPQTNHTAYRLEEVIARTLGLLIDTQTTFVSSINLIHSWRHMSEIFFIF